MRLSPWEWQCHNWCLRACVRVCVCVTLVRSGQGWLNARRRMHPYGTTTTCRIAFFARQFGGGGGGGAPASAEGTQEAAAVRACCCLCQPGWTRRGRVCACSDAFLCRAIDVAPTKPASCVYPRASFTRAFADYTTQGDRRGHRDHEHAGPECGRHFRRRRGSRGCADLVGEEFQVARAQSAEGHGMFGYLVGLSVGPSMVPPRACRWVWSNFLSWRSQQRRACCARFSWTGKPRRRRRSSSGAFCCFVADVDGALRVRARTPSVLGVWLPPVSMRMRAWGLGGVGVDKQRCGGPVRTPSAPPRHMTRCPCWRCRLGAVWRGGRCCMIKKRLSARYHYSKSTAA